MRHLIYLIDGTWLSAHQEEANSVYSNVYKLNLMLEPKDLKGNAQIVFYTRGIGSTGKYLKYTSGGFASGIDDIIADVYLNICSNYRSTEDKIYIFGFSRGAVVARAVSGIIGRVGILLPDYVDNYFAVWKQFTSGRRVPSRSQIKRYMHESPKIDFMGCFETVFGGNHSQSNMFNKLRFRDLHLESCVINSTAIFALDETRGFFDCMLNDRRENFRSGLEQIWMPGVHSDIGGTYRDNFFGKISLLSMIDRLILYTDLNLKINELDDMYKDLLKTNFYNEVVIHDELISVWKYLYYFKNARRTYKIDSECQYLHPIVKIMLKELIRIKKKDHRWEYYMHPSFVGVPEFPYFHRYKFDRSEFKSAWQT